MADSDDQQVTEQQWAPGDVYFGSPDQPLPDWREDSAEGDEDDDTEPSEEDRAGVTAVLGFDPSELWEDSEADLSSQEKAVGSCKPGQNPARDHCTPASQSTSQQAPSTQQPSKGSDQELDQQLGDLEPKVKKGIIAKVKNAAQKLAVKVNWANMAPDILDTIEDSCKIWYRQPPPIPGIPLSSGQWVGLASHVLARAYLFARKKITGKELEDGLGVSSREVVDAVIALYQQMAEAFPGLPVPATREQVSQLLQQAKQGGSGE